MCKKTYAFVVTVFVHVLIASANTHDFPFFLQKNAMFTDESKACNDFYQYACENWSSKTTRPPHEPVWSPWQEVSHRINERLQKILTGTDEGNSALRKAQIFYKSCIDADKFHQKYLRQLRQLVGHLIDEDATRNYSWITTLMKVTRVLNIHPIIKIYLAPDWKNTTKNILYIERGNLILPPAILLYPDEHPRQIKAYREWITRTIREVYGMSNIQVNRMIQFEANLAKIGGIKRTKKRLTVGELMESTPPINWMSVLKKLPVDTGGVNSNTLIATDLNYLQRVLMLVKKTDGKPIVDYITWSVIKDLSRETSARLRHLNFFIDKAVLGVDSDIPRVQECTNHIINYLSYALIRPYVNRHLNRQTLIYVKNMTDEIKGEFAKTLKNNRWMSEHTKVNAIEKVGAVKYLIGHPSWATNEKFVNKYYEDVNVTENHLMNMIELKRFASKNVFANIGATKNLWLPSSPFEVNAYYSILQNAMIIPLGLLEKPFFDVKRQAAANYGAIGSLIGHEISHSLDNIGRHSDKNGNVANWWTKLDVFKFNVKTQCYDYKTKDYLLLAETIADDVGLKLSLSAYKHSKHTEAAQKNSVRKFFVGYAQLWCELSTQSQFLNDDEHSPAKTRVLKSLHNNRDFTEVFNCTQLNKNTCQLW